MIVWVKVLIYGSRVTQGRVVGGHLAGAGVDSGQGGLIVPHPYNPFKRYKLNPETVLEWEELPGKEGVLGAMGRAAATVALPGRIGEAVGASLGAAMKPPRVVRLNWADGNQSVLELPEKLFTVFSVLLQGRQVVTEAATRAEPPEQPGVTEKILDLASSVIQRGAQGTPAVAAAQPDVVGQIEKLASLRDAGILTDEEFAAKKAELLKRL
ncbi:SHOCT domain-containing protein [Actinoplanes sp. NPDC049802]|uniref:SHOCT domain-containing protein n=1 Tax=Actinoplanes sp. NPDC049802 TaxID=3154742 RepID=UPI0033C003D9